MRRSRVLIFRSSIASPDLASALPPTTVDVKVSKTLRYDLVLAKHQSLQISLTHDMRRKRRLPGLFTEGGARGK